MESCKTKINSSISERSAATQIWEADKCDVGKKSQQRGNTRAYMDGEEVPLNEGKVRLVRIITRGGKPQ